jgi:creatinine amidohydrolase
LKILEDILRSLAPQGVKKLVILNGHGGNDFKPLIRELQPLFPQVFLCQLNWYEVVPLKKFFSEEGDHANEMETSLMMHIAPRLVLPLTEAGKGRERKSTFRARKEGWVWFPRPWTKVTEDTGIGDPSKATAEKGQLYLEHITDRMAEFFVELALTGSDKLYE